MNLKPLLLLFLFPFMATAQVTINGKSLDNTIKYTIDWQERKRSYELYVPLNLGNKTDIPVVFVLHGGGGTAKGIERITRKRFNELALAYGFIVVYPNAVSKTWNSGREEILKPKNKDVDDVGFLVSIVDRLKVDLMIDESKIFATGISNGGFMTNRLLCERPDVFKAGAVVTATMAESFVSNCNPDEPVSVMVINGLDDPLVPYFGGDIRLFKKGKSRGRVISTDDYINFWLDHNGCASEERTETLTNNVPDDGTRALRKEYTACEGESKVVLYSIEGGGHTWPGGRQYLGERIIGKTSQEFNACEAIWAFFEEVSSNR